MERFQDRAAAGRLLAGRLLAGDREPWGRQDAVVLGVPRGGVPVAVEVARALGLPLDVIVVRKLGVPYQPELAMGAVGEGGVRVLNDEVLQAARVSPAELADAERAQTAEVYERSERFRAGRARVPLSGRVAVLVDDGVATGSTMRAACRIVRAHGARGVVVAVPVASREAVTLLRADADEVVVLSVPAWFSSVGQWYRDFEQVPDATVTRLLHEADAAEAREDDVLVPAGGVQLAGTLRVPHGARGVVAFAHGSGSSRLSPRNRFVAERLGRAGLATLLLDLLTVDEERHRDNVFDIRLLSSRLAAVCRWLSLDERTADLPIGLFGASTGAAAALATAATTTTTVHAVVSRGGRPDLADALLPLVTAPTLLVVGGRDETVLELNRQAQQRLRCASRLAVVPGATHLFEEPGALPEVALLATEWFLTHLTREPSPATART